MKNPTGKLLVKFTLKSNAYLEYINSFEGKNMAHKIYGHKNMMAHFL